MEKQVTIIVCTRNRAFILPECLESLLSQTTSECQYSILVVDNGSEDETAGLVKELMERHSNLQYVLEPVVGLSRARNRGWEEARTPWLGYVDDDARVPKGFVKRALLIIENYKFDCFGGTYYAWFKYGKPGWISKDFGNKGQLRNTIGLLGKERLSGGNFFAKRTLLSTLGGFSVQLGMSDKLGYGEEDELQCRMLRNGFKIGYDPDLYIEHCVLPYKLKLNWQLASIYNRGKFQGIWQKKLKLFQIFIGLMRSTIASICLKLPRELVLLVINKEKKWQQSLIYIIEPVLLRSGQLSGKLRLFFVKKTILKVFIY
ncbi:MAG: glycosyltransferase [Phaeodactylibacter sp.]|nr:glycosyltransferase [Phaeodactylibacter sp.]